VKSKLPLLTIAILILLFIQVGLVIYAKRGAFLKKYDPNYWQDRFGHSQWTLPISRRDIGDDGIYSFGGYRLIHGESIENTNTNKPPVGIYLIGLSISFFQNPLYFAAITGLFTLITFFFLAKLILKTTINGLLATLLLSLNPLFFVQTTIVLLDLLQTLWLLLNVLFFSLTEKTKKGQVWLIFTAGVTLGLLTETKPPIYVPVILLFEVAYLIFKKQYKLIFIFGSGFLIAIVLPYFRYFQTGHSLIDYLRLHKYMVSIYSQNYNTVHHLAILQALLTGRFPDINTGQLTTFSGWWLFLPLIFTGSLAACARFLTNKSTIVLKGICLFTLIVLVINSFIPAYPRYLIIILPFMILLFSKLLTDFLPKRVLFLFFTIIIIGGLINTTRFLIPDPDPVLQRFYYNFSYQFFQDIYEENLASPLEVAPDRNQFRLLTQGTLSQAGIKLVKFEEIKRYLRAQDNSGTVDIKMTYFTYDLGPFTEEKSLKLVKINNEWKIDWNWDLLLNNYRPGLNLKTDIKLGKRGSIINKEKQVLAEDTPGILISILTKQIDKNKEQAMLSFLSPLTGLAKVLIYNAYNENPLPGKPVAIATNVISLKPAVLEKLKSFSGIIIAPHQTRIYPLPDLLSSVNIKNTYFSEFDTNIYSSNNFHGVLDAEAIFESKLRGQNGGTLNLIDENGNIVRSLIDIPVINGENITI